MKRTIFTLVCFLLFPFIINSQPDLGSLSIQKDFHSPNNNTRHESKSLFKSGDKSIIYQPSIALLNDNQQRYTYTYNSQGDMLSELVEVLNLSSYTNYSRLTNTYDTQGFLNTSVTEFYSNGVWSNVYRHTYTNNPDGNIMFDVYQIWGGSDWVNSDRDSNVYNTQGKIDSCIYQMWVNDNWVNYFKNKYTYDTNGNILSWIKDAWSSSGLFWDGYDSHTYTYDQNGHLLTDLYGLWISYKNGDKGYSDDSFRTYTYDEHGSKLTELATIMTTFNGWVNHYRHTYTNDNNGNMISDLYETFINSVWVNTLRKAYAYDSNNNCILGDSYTWVASWVPAVSDLEIYFNNNSDKISYTATTATIQYATFTGIDDELNSPQSFTLYQNFPNPFNPNTAIKFTLPTNEFVSLIIYDILGKEINTLVNEELPAGNYTKTWNSINLSSGVYFYKLQAGSFSETKKMILTK